MTGVTVVAPAKVNLRLRVLAREASGYHQLETVFCALELADTLEASRTGGSLALDVDGAEVGPAEDNLVVKAAWAFGRAAGVEPEVRFRLTKRIPVGAGLGGGSSDAAAALRALNGLFDAPLDRDQLLEIGARLGADVPFFLCGSSHALAWGRGQRILPLPPLPPRPVLVVKPPFAIPTAEAYRRLAEPRAMDAAILDRAGMMRWELMTDAVNDFETVAFADHPVLATVKKALRDAGAGPVLLAGSGSAVFGVFDTEEDRDAAATHVQGRWPEMTAIRTATAPGRQSARPDP